MSNPVVVFGRSPFINELDIHAIMDDYPSIGHNHFGQHYDVDWLFFYDRWYDHGEHKKIFYPYWFAGNHPRPENSWQYQPKKSPKPIDLYHQEGIEHNGPVLGFRYFSPSISINWAMTWGGFDTIYLVGIDNVETDKQFTHHDGQDMPSCLTPQAHQAFKQFVYECAKQVTIYQCNPAVKDSWELPFLDFGATYGKTQ